MAFPCYDNISRDNTNNHNPRQSQVDGLSEPVSDRPGWQPPSQWFGTRHMKSEPCDRVNVQGRASWTTGNRGIDAQNPSFIIKFQSLKFYSVKYFMQLIVVKSKDTYFPECHTTFRLMPGYQARQIPLACWSPKANHKPVLPGLLHRTPALCKTLSNMWRSRVGGRPNAAGKDWGRRRYAG